MYIPQGSSNNTVNINSILSSPDGFALDPSLDAELSLHNVTSESWSNPNSEAFYASRTPCAACPPRQQSGSPTSTATVATPPTNELNLPFTPSAVNNNNHSMGIYAPTVVLRRPSTTTTTTNCFSDTATLPFEHTANNNSNTNTCTSTSTTPSPLHDFGNLNLNFDQKGALIIDGPVCLMNGDTVEYVDHLLPVSPEASSCGGGGGGSGGGGISTPNSPIMFDLPPTFDNSTNTTTNNNTPEGLDYLQMSTWENNVSYLSPSSSPPPQMGTNQYQLPPPPPPQQQQQQNLTTFTDPFTSAISSASITPMTSLVGSGLSGDEIDQSQQPLPSHRRSAHNAVEKKYRNNINDRIAELKEAVPALRHARVKKDTSTSSHDDDDTDEPVFMDGVAVATKLNKATILQKATEYVFHLQHANNELKQDIDALLTTIATQVTNGQQLAQQYRQHVLQRDALHQQQLLYREKLKRQKKSSHHHYSPHTQQQQLHHHHHHSPVKGENRSLNQQYQQHPQFSYLQQQ